jgi:hypothetical protein
MTDQLQLPGINPVYRLKIEQDNDPSSPRDEWDNLGTMVCWHNRYTLGDEQPKENPGEYRLTIAEEYRPELEERLDRECEKLRDAIGSPYGSREWLQAHKEVDNYAEARVDRVLSQHIIELPLYLYDHGGITMRTGTFGCPWDSGQVGFIYVRVADVKAEYGWKTLTKARRKKIEEYLTAEVRTYDDYLTGQVYGYTVERLDNATGEWDEVDSCWGFFGYDPVESGLCDTIPHFSKEQIERAMADLGEWVTTQEHQGEEA